MNTQTVRIQAISIDNLQCIEHGELDLTNTRKPFWTSILGLYGANGSGKSTFIAALSILKAALSGSSLTENTSQMIRLGAKSAKFSFVFRVATRDSPEHYVDVFYEFCLVRKEEQVPTESGCQTTVFKPQILQERFCVTPHLPNRQPRKTEWVNTDSEEVFVPVTKRKLLLVSSRINAKRALMVGRRLAQENSQSFVFSDKFQASLIDADTSILESRTLKEISDQSPAALVSYLLRRLAVFGRHELFVIDKECKDLSLIPALPLLRKMAPGQTLDFDDPIESVASVPNAAVSFVHTSIDRLNIVLPSIFPGFKLLAHDAGNEFAQDGSLWTKIRLISEIDGKRIPLAQEGAGIKKIVSLLPLLICFYNDASMTLVVDDLDAHLHEHLFGRLVKSFSVQGHGQLIFTAHNLRALETLDKGFMAFTTTVPSERFMRLTNVKETNNLRDVYLRQIMVGSNSEHLCPETIEAEIDIAFRRAGHDSLSEEVFKDTTENLPPK